MPSDTQHQEQWRQLAAEISVYREQYRIPATEATAMPTEYRDKELGYELNARVTDMHKYTQQTAKEPLSRDDARLMHDAAEVETRLVEEQVPAEQVIDHMRTERAEESTLTDEQARAERIAELSRRLKASGQKSGEAPPERSEAYKTALAAMKQRRKEEGRDLKEGDSDGTPISKTAETARKVQAYREEAERDRQQQRDRDDIPHQGDDRGPRYRR